MTDTSTGQSFDHYPAVMTSAQVAELLLIAKVDSVRQMAREGRIPGHREPRRP